MKCRENELLGDGQKPRGSPVLLISEWSGVSSSSDQRQTETGGAISKRPVLGEKPAHTP